MSPLSSFFLPAVIGLAAGIGHGFISYEANLPVSLSEQFLSALQIDLDTDSSYGWGDE